MQLFYAFECKLIEFQQPLYRHAQLSQTDNFWIFNGGWQLRDTETIHSKILHGAITFDVCHRLSKAA